MTDQPTSPPTRPTTDDRDAWRAYWTSQNMPWRTEPEISQERQAYLTERVASRYDPITGSLPFRGVRLSRADVEWLNSDHGQAIRETLATAHAESAALDLRGADLRSLDLSALPLTQALLAYAQFMDANMEDASLEGADCNRADFEGANLRGTKMTHASLIGANLLRARFHKADLSGANLRLANMQLADLNNCDLAGAILWDANLQDANLVGAHLEGAKLIGTHLERAHLAEAHCQRVNFARAHLEDSLLLNTDFAWAYFWRTHLERADMSGAHLSGTSFFETHLEGANLAGAHFEGTEVAPSVLHCVRVWFRDFPTVLPPADLRTAFFDSATNLESAKLGDESHGFISVADVRWGNVNLAVVDWSAVDTLGDERMLHERTTSDGKVKDASILFRERQAAVRACRQLATILRSQGLNESADHFAYRAQVLQRELLWLEVGLPHWGLWRKVAEWLGRHLHSPFKPIQRLRKLGQWAFSLLLGALAGYGYKPGRTLIAYIVTVLGFTGLFLLTSSVVKPHVDFGEALILSISSFHGRGFLPQTITLGDPYARIAVVEAVFGLVIEVSFIATFTQRFFAK